MNKFTGLLVYLVVLSGTFKGCTSNEHPAVLLTKAGQDLAFQPLLNSQDNASNVPKFVELPRFDDLATTRLQVKTNDVVDRLWKNINNVQRFAIIKEKGAAKEILKLFGLLQNDIFALDNQITRSKVNNFVERGLQLSKFN